MRNFLSLPILVVDDSKIMTAVLRACLQDMGIKNVDVVESGAAALRMLATKNYGVILSDWHMEPVNGPEFLKQVRALRGAHRPKFAFVSMDGRWGNIATARELGADAYISKPANPRALRAKIAAFVQQRMH